MNATPRPFRQRGVPVIVKDELLDLGITTGLSYGLAYHAPGYRFPVLAREYQPGQVLDYRAALFLRLYLVENLARPDRQRSHLLDACLLPPGLGNDDALGPVNHD